MPCGIAICMSPSITRELKSAWMLTRSLATPGMSNASVMPSASSKMSTGGRRVACVSRLLDEAGVAGRVVTLSVMTVSLRLLDLDRARPSSFTPWHADLQDAVAIGRLDALGIDVVRQRNAAAEFPFIALLAVVRRLVVARRLPFAGDEQQVLLDGNLEF